MPEFKLNGKTYSGSTSYTSTISYIEEDGSKTTVQNELDELNMNLGGFTPIIDETGKITGYKTNVRGADTVFPFKGGASNPLYILHMRCGWPSEGKTIYVGGINLLNGDHGSQQALNNNTTALSKSYTLSGIATLQGVYPSGTTGNYVTFTPLINCKGLVCTSAVSIEETEFIANQTYKYSNNMVTIIIYE